ncbi:MAG: phosphate ABC transporter substrate-binding protein [Barnesiella sp.]|nr:phosphate ABC transporter substrate-binding protein [Barnesiella sp.]
MKLRNILFSSLAALCMGMVVTSCDKKATTTSTSGLATMVCDATFENIMSQEIDVFEYIYPNASIMPYYLDEKACVDSLLDFNAKLAVLARPLTEKETEYLKSHKKQVRQQKIAVDAIALIVNPDNEIDELSKPEIAEILSGKLTRWDEVEPSKLGNIEVVFDHQGSSTVQYMRDSLLNGADFAANVYAQKNPEGVFEAVANNKNAIGIIGVSWISADMNKREVTREEIAAQLEQNDTTNLDFDSRVKVLKVRGNDTLKSFKPYQAYIFDGSYPLYRSIYMISTGAGGTVGHGFYSFVTGFKGQKIIQLTGVLPATVHPQFVNVN